MPHLYELLSHGIKIWGSLGPNHFAWVWGGKTFDIDMVCFSHQFASLLLDFLTNATSDFTLMLEVYTLDKMHTCTLNILLWHTRNLVGNCHYLQSVYYLQAKLCRIPT